MRTYAPATVIKVLDELLAEPSMARGVVHHELSAGRRCRHGPLPAWLDPRIQAGLAKRGIDRLYSHQAEAIEAVHAGHDVVVVTPTASGKSLCYTLPVLQALAEDRSARALFLFPTKALGQDQVAECRTLAADRARRRLGHATTATRRRRSASAIRTAGQVVVTNPDMLHAAILPHHTKWFQLFEQLQVIVVDELHTYRGVFGSHVANVLRRLLRLCAHYGSQPGHRLLLGDDRQSGRARRDRSPAGRPRRSIATGRRRARGTSLLRRSARCSTADRRPRLGPDPRAIDGPCRSCGPAARRSSSAARGPPSSCS